MCDTSQRADPARAERLLAEAEARLAADSTRQRVSIDQCFLLERVEALIRFTKFSVSSTVAEANEANR